ncbi:GNAT family N-acetyltransferase (plasmid) [Rossellomorea sp. AcN35-11]|nr:GNAT family N-acetyltransferase [Rossellomorea aquimaris]WJV32031.1 GNAT family N-acetyltransferase [Rossellomorea sp. AcN35-11]
MWNQGDLYLEDINWGHSFEEEGYLRIQSNLKVYKMNEDVEEGESVPAGFIDVRVFDERWGNMLYAADVDCDAFAAMETYVGADKEFERIAVLNRISIEEKFQGKGIASHVIEQLHHFLKEVLDVDVVLLIASPGVGAENLEEKTHRLVQFYSQFGYIQMTEDHANHMWLDLLGEDDVLDGATLSIPKSEVPFWDRFFRYAKHEAVVLKGNVGDLDVEKEGLLDEVIAIYDSNLQSLEMIKNKEKETVALPFTLLEIALVNFDLGMFVDEIREGIVKDAPDLQLAQHYYEIIKEICESDEFEPIISALIEEYKADIFE